MLTSYLTEDIVLDVCRDWIWEIGKCHAQYGKLQNNRNT